MKVRVLMVGEVVIEGESIEVIEGKFAEMDLEDLINISAETIDEEEV